MKDWPYKKTKKPTLAEEYLRKALVEFGQSVVTHYTFFRFVQLMYQEGEKLYLRRKNPTVDDHYRYLQNMYRSGVVRYENDYKTRLIRVVDVPGQTTEDIVCIADPLCYVSHMSAMQRWGLTVRNPIDLMLTRPDKSSSVNMLREMMLSHPNGLPPEAVHLKYIGHPDEVNGRKIRMIGSKNAGSSINVQGTSIRISTIGQTFLDMLQKPALCGGMRHVLEVFDEFALDCAEEIIDSVDSAAKEIVKIRAGYILEERLKIRHEKIDSWKQSAQRGGSRKLDPSRAFTPQFSESWMMSINV